MSDKPKCSFCGRPQNEVKALISSASQSTHICDGCLEKGIAAVRGRAAKEMTEEAPLPKPLEIEALLDQYVIGQPMAKAHVSMAVYNHYKRRRALQNNFVPSDGEVEIDKSNVLIAGPSGCGKTALARTIARILKVPFYVGDATKLTQSGYAGDDVDMLLQGLLEQCGWDVEKAQWGIIVIDEIDKLSRSSGREVSGYRDVSGEGVQQALLKITEGGKVTVAKGNGARLIDASQQATVQIDTSNILFIGMGSFDGIQRHVDKRLNSSATLGFGAPLRQKLAEGEAYTQLEEDDFLQFGIIPELMGRFPILTSVLSLTVEELHRILTEPKNALVKQFRALYEMDGITLQFDDEAVMAIAEKAKKRKTGARALRGVLEELLVQYSRSLPSDPNVKGLRITRAFTLGEGEPILTRREVRVAQA